MIKPILEQLIAGIDLATAEMQAVMQDCMSGALTDSEIAAFLVAMRMKGETVEELTAAAKVMLTFSRPIDLGNNCIDIVGTGGDGRNTFNISTCSAIVAAGAGAKIAKHGNFSISSSSGSANVLELAGIPLKLEDAVLQNCIKATNLCFLFAPAFHKAMQYTRTARLHLGIRSFFNLLGPLINPARLKRQVVGVFPASWQDMIAVILKNLGSERAMVITSQDGLDEISISAPTRVIELKQGQLSQWTINPGDYHLSHPNLDSILVNSPKQSLELIQSVLQGEKGAARDIVVLNAALVLYCADLASSYSLALDMATEAIDTGSAFHCLEQLKKWTNL